MADSEFDVVQDRPSLNRFSQEPDGRSDLVGCQLKEPSLQKPVTRDNDGGV